LSLPEDFVISATISSNHGILGEDLNECDMVEKSMALISARPGFQSRSFNFHLLFNSWILAAYTSVRTFS
jgi:hypothetical protein